MKDVFRQCISGLHCLYKNGIVHKDIKPYNILINDNLDPIICDFGVSEYFPDQSHPDDKWFYVRDNSNFISLE